MVSQCVTQYYKSHANSHAPCNVEACGVKFQKIDSLSVAEICRPSLRISAGQIICEMMRPSFFFVL